MKSKSERSKSQGKAKAKPGKARPKATRRAGKPALDEGAVESEPQLEPVASASPAPEKPAKRRGKAPVDLATALVEAWSTHERIHQFLLEHLDPQAWSTPAPIGKGRTIRGAVCHIHNVRLLWLQNHAPEDELPERLDRETATLEEARAALAASALAMAGLLRAALADGGRVPDFKPDVVNFASYAMAHEAHHRGQICLLARALGKPLPQSVGFGLWEWRKRHGEAHPQP